VRTILEFSAESVKIADWVADEAVWCEPLSASSSLIIRENTGNFAISGGLRSDLDQLSLAFSRVFVEIPYSTEQGIILA
jgi:hypothetical protein